MATHGTDGNGNGASHKGKITQVIGPVVDVEFAGGRAARGLHRAQDHEPQRRPERLGAQSHRRGRAAPRRAHRAHHRHGLDRRPGARHGGRPTPHAPIMMPVGKEVLGRILNVIGEPVDERGPVNAKKHLPIHRARAQVRRPVGQGRGVRDRHQGHRPARALPPRRQDRPVRRRRRRQDRAHHGAHQQRRQEARRRLLLRRRRRAHPRGQRPLARDGGVEARRRASRCSRKTALIYGQMNEPPGARARVALSALTCAEYFRDEEGQDVLLFVDNIFRFTQAGSEVSALLGRIPSAVGYQPTLSTEMGELQERITSTNKGSITSVQAIYVPADDLTDPAPATAFAHLDATTVLSRAHLRARHLPGRRSARLDVDDPVAAASSARSTTQCARDVQRVLQRYKELQDIIAILGMDELSEDDKLLVGARAQDPALPVAAVLRRQGVHRRRRQVRRAQGHHPRLPRDRRRQVRRPARAGVLHGRHHRRGGRRRASASSARRRSRHAPRSGHAAAAPPSPPRSTRSPRPACAGEFGVLPGHTPFLTALQAGRAHLARQERRGLAAHRHRLLRGRRQGSHSSCSPSQPRSRRRPIQEARALVGARQPAAGRACRRSDSGSAPPDRKTNRAPPSARWRRRRTATRAARAAGGRTGRRAPCATAARRRQAT